MSRLSAVMHFYHFFHYLSQSSTNTLLCFTRLKNIKDYKKHSQLKTTRCDKRKCRQMSDLASSSATSRLSKWLVSHGLMSQLEAKFNEGIL